MILMKPRTITSTEHRNSQMFLRASTSVRVLYTPIFTLKTYFFYFTHPFLPNSHISLSILSPVLFKKSFSYFSYYYFISNPLSPLTRLSLHSRDSVLESPLKLLSIPTFSLLFKTPFYSKLSEISIQAGSTTLIWNFNPSWNFHLKFKRRSEISIWNSNLSTMPIWNSNPSTARRTPIQARWEECRSKHSDLSTPICHKRRSTPLYLHWCVRVWVCLVLWCLWVVLLLILWLIFDFVCGSVCIRGRGIGCADGEEREKKGAKLEIIKIMYRWATVTVHICTVTVAHGNF